MENELETLETLVVWLEGVGNFTKALYDCENEEDFKNYINNKLVTLSFVKEELEKGDGIHHLEYSEIVVSLNELIRRMYWLSGEGVGLYRTHLIGFIEVEIDILRSINMLQQSLIRMLLRRVTQ